MILPSPQIIGLALLLLGMAGCGPSGPSPAHLVGNFLGAYSGDFRAVDQTMLSQALAAKIAQAVATETGAAEGKPLLLEGEIFCGLYQGFTGFALGEVMSQAGQGDGAVVEIIFTSQAYEVSWSDRFVLINEGGWKIDNVIYTAKKAGMLSLVEVLDNFIALPDGEEVVHN